MATEVLRNTRRSQAADWQFMCSRDHVVSSVLGSNACNASYRAFDRRNVRRPSRRNGEVVRMFSTATKSLVGRENKNDVNVDIVWLAQVITKTVKMVVCSVYTKWMRKKSRVTLAGVAASTNTATRKQMELHASTFARE
ncbi:hypothetical protein ERJ75_000074500 [Trypanosoma vivax]|uniref:Uncharacterized protein n=1 Tax=Trypanosoma vivax (strain Y486) TaxID=1055687 RepID=F9WK99_TRYVY|nr:hypothetical protein ERJ75_000074500 [Trypanosoma vivax]CCD17919.1 hypothetical protein TvY486_0005450 [Trypanosoma vivax Y486]|eukprot:CCD17919.1 hypothetical protein TvY486_0005450 [Trypanosoma vivax Y486]